MIVIIKIIFELSELFLIVFSYSELSDNSKITLCITKRSLILV